MADRPMINVYEGTPEALVYREMNDTEYAVWQADQAALPSLVLADLRAQRDGLLGGCDWTQLSDAVLTADQVTAWKTYRQQLRDWPDQAGFDPLNPPGWPVPPTAPAGV